MPIDQSLDADLPPPRGDDPPSLRQDIIDELADHLDCAIRRERLTHPSDPAAAEPRALARFGNPQALARTLWFDALQEQFMSQRLVIALCVALLFVCLGLAGIVWQTQAANRALAAQQQELATQLVEVLRQREPAAAIEPSLPQDWTNLRFRFVRSEQHDAPVAGVIASISQRATQENRGVPERLRTSGEDGVVDFGSLRFGVYTLRTEVDGWKSVRAIDVHPGGPPVHELECLTIPVAGKLKLELEPSQPIPPELVPRLWMTVLLSNVTAGEWSRDEAVYVTRRPDGRCCLWSDKDLTQSLADPSNEQLPIHLAAQNFAPGSSRMDLSVRFTPAAKWVEEVELPSGLYQPLYQITLEPDDDDTLLIPQLKLTSRDAKNQVSTSVGGFEGLGDKTEVSPEKLNHWEFPVASRYWRIWSIQRQLAPGEEAYEFSLISDRSLLTDPLTGAESVDLLFAHTLNDERTELLRGVRIAQVDMRYFHPAPAPGLASSCNATLWIAIRPQERPLLDQLRSRYNLFVRPIAPDADAERGEIDSQLRFTSDSGSAGQHKVFLMARRERGAAAP